MPKPVSLQDVAAAAGVSAAAVSMALRNRPGVSPRRSEEIRRVAARLGYRPDPALARRAALRWRGPRTPVPLAVVTTPHPTDAAHDSALVARLLAHAERLGYGAREYPSGEYATPAALGQVLFARGIRSAIVGPVCDPEFCGQFPWDGFGVVAVGAGFFRPPVHLVLPDLGGAAWHAWAEARRRGYRRIGFAFLSEYRPPIDQEEKEAAAWRCHHAVGRAGRVPPLFHAPRDAAAVVAWARRHRVDCVIAQTATALAHLRASGRRVPAQIGFVALALSDAAHDRQVAGFVRDFDLLAEHAAGFMDQTTRGFRQGRPAALTTLRVSMPWNEGLTLPGRGRLSAAAPEAAAEPGTA